MRFPNLLRPRADLNVTPDGARYAAASTQRVARPFHYRWLLPKLCGQDPRRWALASYLSTLALLPAVYFFIGGWRGVAAAVMVTGLAGVWSFNRRFPILVDAAGMACALGSADLFIHHLWPLGLALALIAGCVRETSPIFAALFAWNPLALIGLAPVAVRHMQREGPDPLLSIAPPADQAEHRFILDHPFAAARKYHSVDRVPRWKWVLPWGAALVALASPSPQLYLTLVVAYSQCLVATDTVRLYMWAFPVVLAAATRAVPLRWLPFLVALQLMNPYASEGS